MPLNEPSAWQARMVITPTPNGDPRSVVDFQPINHHSVRQTHHTESPWALAASIPAGTKKSVLDAWHGYHSVPIAEEDRHYTTFLTPKGFLAAGDGYSDRTDRIVEGVTRLKKCVDDCLLYDQDIETNFFRVCEFLSLCSANGIIFNPSKIQLAEDEVAYVGFTVTDMGVRPTEDFLSNIMSFPTPKCIADVRSWFGAVAQISYAFATAPVMLPFRHLLSNKIPFSWSPDLEQASKLENIRQCEEGVRTFDPALPTALASDWSAVKWASGCVRDTATVRRICQAAAPVVGRLSTVAAGSALLRRASMLPWRESVHQGRGLLRNASFFCLVCQHSSSAWTIHLSSPY